MAQDQITIPISPPEPVSAASTKEAGPASVDISNQIERPVDEFVQPSNPEINPQPDVAGFIQPNRVVQPPQDLINAEAAEIPADPVQTALADLSVAHVAAQGDIKSSRTWFGALREFVDKRIIAKLTGRTLQPSNI